MESHNFAHWMSVHGKPSLLPSEVKALTKIMFRATEADLISILYHGEDKLALEALKELKNRFTDEMHLLEQMAWDRSMNAGGAK